MQHKYLDVLCHLPWRSPRQTGRRVLILPDGNGRMAPNLEGYAAGADNVVACGEYLAQRGDIDTTVFCIVSDLNARKRSDSFFEAIVAQFARLRTNIVTKGYFLRHDVRCRVLGNVDLLRAKGGVRQTLVEEAEAIGDVTSAVSQPRMQIEFWFAYSADIALQSDVDLVIRTGAEEPDVVRPGMSLPPHMPCIVTPTPWPNVEPAQIGALIDYALRDQVPQFAPGYDLRFIEALRRVFPAARIPSPVRLTVPVCAPESNVLAMLQRTYEAMDDDCPIRIRYMGTSGTHELGPRDDLWYELRLVPAARWTEYSSEAYDAILTPGQQGGCVRLAMPAGQAHVHSCVATANDVLLALGGAVRFPVKHVLLHGADRSSARETQLPSTWSADLLNMVHETTQKPHSTVEELVKGRVCISAQATTENELLLKGTSAKALGRALEDGLLLPDEPVRQSDRNYAYTGAYMMLRVPDEGNPTGMLWETAAEMAIRCMLAISTGDNGVFDRMYPGETHLEWQNRIATSARYLIAAMQTDRQLPTPGTRDARLLRVLGGQWRAMLDPYLETHPEVVAACRDALRRHYLANSRERSADVVDNPLVHWLCLGGLPRREAFREIEHRYAQTSPAPIREKIRALLTTDVTDDDRFQAMRREMKVLLHLVDTAHSIAVEVLFLFCALTIPKQAVTTERLKALIELGQIADYAFRLANDVSSLRDDVGGDQDQTKESSLSILIPKASTLSERVANLERARALGRTILSWLERDLSDAIQRLHSVWPSMAKKVMRAVHVGKAVYAEAHYTTLSESGMLALLQKLDDDEMRTWPSRPTVLVAPRTMNSSPSALGTSLHLMVGDM